MKTLNNQLNLVCRTKFSLRYLPFFLGAILIFGTAANMFAQEIPPAPSAPRESKIPPAVEKRLPNGMRVVVINRPNVPLVSARLLIASAGSFSEGDTDTPSGIADFTASLLTKGTRTRTATKISEEIEFLGANLNASANYRYTAVDASSMSDKFPQVLAIMADVVKNPAFSNDEIERLRQQTIDNLNIEFKQPNFLARQTAKKVITGQSPSVGTPQSIATISSAQIKDFYRNQYEAYRTTLIIIGDIAPASAFRLAANSFGQWQGPPRRGGMVSMAINDDSALMRQIRIPSQVTEQTQIINKIIVVDLPNSGQAAVTVGRKANIEYGETNYFRSRIYNAILGEGFTSRLNQEIRIKRGLTYGAGSSFLPDNLFVTRTQTKNETAVEVAELVLQELNRINETLPSTEEMKTRSAVAVGAFNELTATNSGLMTVASDLIINSVDFSRLNQFVRNLREVGGAEVRDFSSSLNPTPYNYVGINNEAIKKRFMLGEELTLVIAGDAKVFLPKLEDYLQKGNIAFSSDFETGRAAPRSGVMSRVEVIPASELDLDSETLRRKK